MLMLMLNGFGLLVNSIDRLLVITFPILYYHHNKKIVTILLILLYSVVLLAMAIFIVIELLLPRRLVSPDCL